MGLKQFLRSVVRMFHPARQNCELESARPTKLNSDVRKSLRLEPIRADGMSPPPKSLTQTPRINLVFRENDDHRATADFTIVVHFRRHFIRVRDSDFKNFKTSWASDFSKFHDADLHRIQISPTAESLLGRAKIQVSPTSCQFKPPTTQLSYPDPLNSLFS